MPDKLKKLFGWLDFGGTIAGVGANILSTILTNRKNEQLAKMQNAFQKQENELAYQRAKPQNQVSQMMQAGMSKAGALNAINGGATYQPAPITSATAQAPQIDLSSAFDGLMQIGENAKQRKMQEDLQAKQIKAAEEAQKAQIASDEKKHAAQLESNERIAAANRTSTESISDKDRSLRERELQLKEHDFEFRKEQYKDTAELVKSQKKLTDVQRRELAAKLEEWQSEPAFSARQAKYQAEEIADLFNYRLSEKSLIDYLGKYYEKNDKGEYVPIDSTPISVLEHVTDVADKVWSLILTIIPIRTILQSVKLFG